jgi:PAS domain S-box-containing protein
MERRNEDADGPVRPRWTVPVAAVAVAAVLVVASVAYLSFRHVAAARRRVGDEIEALLEIERVETKTQLGTLIVRDYLVTGRAEAVADLRAHAGVVRDLLRRAAARPDTAAAAAVALDAQVKLEALWWELLGAPVRGRPDRNGVQRFEAEVIPAGWRLDAAVAEVQRIRASSFRDARAVLAGAEKRALWALVATTLAMLVVGLALLLMLRRSLQELRAGEHRFRTIFEHAPVGIAHVGLDGRWLRLNARYRDILGYPEEELRQLTSRDVTHPEDAEKDARQVERLLAGEIGGYALEKRYLRKDGDAAWVDFTASLVRDRSGRPWYFITAAEDIGDRKEIERQLREAVRARDELMQVASHELRTPLTTLQLQVESLRTAVARGAEPAKATAKADSALRQVARVDALVDGLLDVARLDDASFDLRSERGDLAGALRQTVENLRPIAAREGVELRLDAPEQLVTAFDRKRVDQAVAALISNAVKYGPGKPVDVRVEAVHGLARITVRDRGIGVDATERERIFGRFERAVSARHYGGLGLGLFITRRIAQAHGGTVRVESAPEQGSVFVLELPLGGAEGDGTVASGAGI